MRTLKRLLLGCALLSTLLVVPLSAGQTVVTTNTQSNAQVEQAGFRVYVGPSYGYGYGGWHGYGYGYGYRPYYYAPYYYGSYYYGYPAYGYYGYGW